MGFFRQLAKRRATTKHSGSCHQQAVMIKNGESDPGKVDGTSKDGDDIYSNSTEPLESERRNNRQEGHLYNLKNISAIHIQDSKQLMKVTYGQQAGAWIADRFQKVEPWVESLPRIRKSQQHEHSDSLTDPTSFCSAFEMLSIDNICGDGSSGEISYGEEDDDVTPLPDDNKLFLDVPREIRFERIDSTRHGKLRQEMEVKGQTPPFVLNNFRNLILGGRRPRNVSSVIPDVKIYVEQPKPLENDTNSVEYSTVTWPAEYRRDPMSCGHRKEIN